MIDAFFEQKTTIPKLPNDYFVRQRLFDCFDKNRPSVIAIVAPLGYGKTCLVSHWFHFSKAMGDFKYIALDDNDNDVSQFLTNVIASLMLRDEDVTVHTITNSNGDFNNPQFLLEKVLKIVNKEVHEVTICLDNYEVITNDKVHNTMQYLLKCQLPMLHWIILSRTTPPLPFQFLEAQGQLIELTESDLCFTDDESLVFLRSLLGEDFSKEDLSTLIKHNEGWAIALKLDALYAKKSCYSCDSPKTLVPHNSTTISSLIDDIFDSQPAELQYFLLITSILDNICLPLCDSLLEAYPYMDIQDNQLQSTPNKLFQDLHKYHLFVVPIDSRDHWFRYRAFFRDYLRNRLKMDYPDMTSDLHRIASSWFMRRVNNVKMRSQAIKHLLLAGDWDSSKQMIEDFGMDKILQSDFKTVAGWTGLFPKNIMDVHSLLYLISCSAQETGWSGSRMSLEDYLRKAGFNNATRNINQQNRLIEAYVLLGMVTDVMPNPKFDAQSTIDFAQRMLELMADNDSLRSSYYVTLAFGYAAAHDAKNALSNLVEGKQAARANDAVLFSAIAGYYESKIMLELGQLREAARIALHEQERCKAILAEIELDSPITGWFDIIIGGVLLEQNRLEESERHLIRGIEKAARYEARYIYVDGLVDLHRLYLAQGEHENALGILSHLQIECPDYSFVAESLRLKCLVAQESKHTAKDYILQSKQIDSPFAQNGDQHHLPGMGPYGGSTAYFLAYLSWARIQTLIGRPKDALRYIDEHLSLVENNELNGRVILLLVEQALALAVLGYNKKAIDALRQALLLAMPQGYIRVFDCNSIIDELLIEAASTQELREYVKLILNSNSENSKAVITRELETEIEGGSDLDHEVKFSTEFLTERELEVYYCVANGMSNKNIAFELHIKIGTVKAHVSSIMRKLGCPNRSTVVLHAKRLGQYAKTAKSEVMQN